MAIETQNNWSLGIGDKIERKALHEAFGGRTQGGIGPSKQSDNVFVFTDAVAGLKHGYIDGWGKDGCFHYTGEGQVGDQVMKSGNASILKHKDEGRALRLFDGARGSVTYMGEFEVAEGKPYYFTDAPETGGGPVRQVIVFRLRPLNGVSAPAANAQGLPNVTVSEDVPLEGYYTEKTVIEPSREPYEAERKEAELVTQLSNFLKSKRIAVVRRKIIPANEAKALYTDMYLPDQKVLIEAKGSVTRESIRMAIGQLFDYRRFFEDATCALLVPSEPREDLMKLCDSLSIGVIWPEEKGFHIHGQQLNGL